MERLNNGQAAYGYRWQRRRENFLREHPLCCFCWKIKRVVAAMVVDHIIPHRGDPELFWDESNWQSLCSACHNSVKQAEEKRGYSNAVGANGWPIDPKHPANKKEKF